MFNTASIIYSAIIYKKTKLIKLDNNYQIFFIYISIPFIKLSRNI